MESHLCTKLFKIIYRTSIGIASQQAWGISLNEVYLQLKSRWSMGKSGRLNMESWCGQDDDGEFYHCPGAAFKKTPAVSFKAEVHAHLISLFRICCCDSGKSCHVLITDTWNVNDDLSERDVKLPGNKKLATISWWDPAGMWGGEYVAFHLVHLLSMENLTTLRKEIKANFKILRNKVW